MINALNSGARVFMADLEDALSPTWANVVGGQAAHRRRGAPDAHVRIAGGQAVSARRADRDARRPAARLAPRRVRRARRWRPDVGEPVRLRAVPVPQRCRGAAPRERTVPLPRRSSSRTTRRGCGTTCSSTRQAALGIPRGSIRATVLIETILAAFEMDEILYELREHAAGLNAGPVGLPVQRHQEVAGVARPGRPGPVAADDDRAVHARLHGAARADLPPSRCARDRRDGGVHPEPARPGRHARSPWPGSATTRSARSGDGFDGTWVAHPDLVPVATEVFDGVLGRPTEPEGAAPRGGVGRRGAAARPARPGRRRDRGRRPGERRGSRWRTSIPGCAASAPPPSTT